MSGIFIKTGTKKLSGTDGNVEIKICDQQENCCKTSDDLDNELNNFENGDIDVFTTIDMLGECAKVCLICSFQRAEICKKKSSRVFNVLGQTIWRASNCRAENKQSTRDGKPRLVC